MEGQGIERELLERTDLASSYDFWQAVIVWAAIVGAVLVAVASIVGFYANDQVTRVIPKLAAEKSEKLDAEIMKQPASAWPTRVLLKNGWQDKKVSGELTVLVHKTVATPSEYQPTEALIKKGDQTLAWARAVAFGDHRIWPYGPVVDYLEDGANKIPIEKALAGAGLAEFVRQTGTEPVDVIGVGLESSSGGDPNDTFRELSDTRGMHLVGAADKVITIVSADKSISLRTLGLGRALTHAEKDSDQERRQRTALVIVIARMSHDTIMLPLNEALTTLIMDVPLTSVDLRDYEYFTMAAKRLSAPLVFGDAQAEPWTAPRISVQEALALRAAPVQAQ